MAETYWNGEPAEAFHVRAYVPKHNPDVHPPQAWWAGKQLPDHMREAAKQYGIDVDGQPPIDLQEQWVDAVLVLYMDQQHLLYNGDSSGWYKVTTGRGSPRVAHRSLPGGCKIEKARSGP